MGPFDSRASFQKNIRFRTGHAYQLYVLFSQVALVLRMYEKLCATSFERISECHERDPT